MEKTKKYNKYKKINKEKTIEEQFNYWNSRIDNNMIEHLKDELLKIFKQMSRKDFKDDVIINCVVSTCGYNRALHKVLDKEPFGKEFFTWYDSLEWYDSDNFDGLIEERLLEKG